MCLLKSPNLSQSQDLVAKSMSSFEVKPGYIFALLVETVRLGRELTAEELEEFKKKFT
jgi:hypothetical protein